MTRPRTPVKRLVTMALVLALPGLAVIAALLFLHAIAPLPAMGAAIGCVLIAAIIASPLARDLAQVARYGDELAHRGRAETPDLSGWAPASELAAVMRRIQRETAERERKSKDDAVTGSLLFDALPQPLILIDDARRIVALNRVARQFAAAAAVGGSLSAAIRDPELLEACEDVLADGGHRAVGFSVTAPVERHFWAEVVPFAQAGEKTFGARALIALYDLTERQRAEQMRADFVANASHELRTPLASLIGFIETLQGPAKDDAPAREEFLALMHDQATRMSHLVRDLLSLSAIELHEHTLPSGAASITGILERVVGTLQGSAAKREMTLDLNAGPLPPVAGDDEQLTQVFQNLIDNAIKYGRRGGKVGIAATAQNGEVRVSISDEGEGIPARHIPRLTERFYRVDPARSRAVGGTGLGLAIVKHIVSRHRGRLEIESVEGKGSTFSVILPAAEKS